MEREFEKILTGLSEDGLDNDGHLFKVFVKATKVTTYISGGVISGFLNPKDYEVEYAGPNTLEALKGESETIQVEPSNAEAEQVLADAKAAAEQILADAKGEAEKLVADGQAEVTAMQEKAIVDINAEAEKRLGRANEEAAKTLSDAKAEAKAIADKAKAKAKVEE